MPSDKRKIDTQRAWPQVIDLQISRHCEHVERAVELGHRLVHQRRDDAAVDVAWRPLVPARQVDDGCGRDLVRVRSVNRERQMQTFGILRTTAEAVVGLLIDGARGGCFRQRFRERGVDGH